MTSSRRFPAGPLTLAAIVSALLVSACAAPAPPEANLSTRSANTSGFTETDFECMREAIYFEAAASDPRGQHAVADVILNRMRDGRFPNSVCGVITDGQARGACQFSYRCDRRAETFADRRKFATASVVAQEALTAPDEDITDGALFFHAAWMRPGWFATLKRTAALGGQYFYR